MTDPVPAKPEPTLPRPPHGGSFIRQEDGSLVMVEGAIAKPKTIEPDAEADTSAAPLELSAADQVPADTHPDQPAPAGEHHEG